MISYNTCLDRTPFSVFEQIETAINNSNYSADFIKLHQGKTTFKPKVELDSWEMSGFSLLPHEHASPSGIKDLKKIICQKLSKDQFFCTEDNILITSGATHGIEVILRTILEPGEEVMILSPQWLFIAGLITSLNCYPIEAPIFLELDLNSNFDFIEVMSKKVTKKTKAIYFNTPNNPTGYSLNEEQLKAIALFAKKHNLWIITDNAYENYDFTKHGFLDIRSYHDAKERTFSVYSFSKTFAMPGYRVGYIVVPDSIIMAVKKRVLYSVYSISTISQYAAFYSLKISNDLLREYKNKVKQSADIIEEKLQIPHTKIQGGLYTFLNISQWQKGNINDFIEKCISNGISLAPGEVFGSFCKEYARLCFTSVTQEKLVEAINRLNKIYFT